MSIYTQRQANYGNPKDGFGNKAKPWQKCQTCDHFDPDYREVSDKCRIVQGTIEPTYTCNYYTAAETIDFVQPLETPEVSRQSFHQRLDTLNLPDYGE